MARLCTNYEGVRGLRVNYKRALLESGSIGIWRVAWLKKIRRKKVMKKKMRTLWQKKMYKLWQKKSWRKLT